MSPAVYKKISLPEPLIKRIKKLIKSRPDLGYISPSDFVRHVVIEKLEKLAPEPRKRSKR